MATVAERIQKELLRSRSPLDDDQLAERVGVRRQAINQECRYDSDWELWRLQTLEEDGAWQTIHRRSDTPMS